MQTKKIVTVVLLAFVCISVGYALIKENSKSERNESAEILESDASEAVPSHRVIAYYFYGNARCPSCIKIENYTEEAIYSDFAEAVEDGSLVWRPINTDKPGNEHYLQMYDLYTKSVVIVDTRDGEKLRWKNLEEVWNLLNDKEAFLAYIRDEVSSYLGEA